MSILLPPNATPLELDLEQVQARIGALPVEILKLYQPQACPAHLLPWMAWQFSVDEWDSQWTEQMRRDVIAESVKLHQKKGTVWAVKRILALTGLPDTTLYEWWQPHETYELLPDLPVHTFHLRVWSTPGSNPVVITHEKYDSIRRLVDWTKPARSHYTFDIGARFKDSITAFAGHGHAQRTQRTAIPRHTAKPETQAVIGIQAGAGHTARLECAVQPDFKAKAIATPVGVSIQQGASHAARLKCTVQPDVKAEAIATLVGVSIRQGASHAARLKCMVQPDFKAKSIATPVGVSIRQGASLAAKMMKTCQMLGQKQASARASLALNVASAGCQRLQLSIVL